MNVPWIHSFMNSQDFIDFCLVSIICRSFSKSVLYVSAHLYFQEKPTPSFTLTLKWSPKIGMKWKWCSITVFFVKLNLISKWKPLSRNAFIFYRIKSHIWLTTCFKLIGFFDNLKLKIFSWNSSGQFLCLKWCNINSPILKKEILLATNQTSTGLMYYYTCFNLLYVINHFIVIKCYSRNFINCKPLYFFIQNRLDFEF
jgi:hypothetical protein